MTIPYPKYVQVKDVYCIMYLGKDSRILDELELLCPILSKQYALDIRIIQEEDPEEKFAGVSLITDMASFASFLEENDLPLPKFLNERAYITSKTKIDS